MTRTRIALALGTLLLLAGCTATTTADAPAPGAPASTVSAALTATDVAYLHTMITHHEQALEIVRLATERATNPTIRTLAAAIDATQADELATMRDWLGSPPASSADDTAPPHPAGHHEHAHQHGPGIEPATGPEDIARLRATATAQFDTALLNLLIAHQQSAAELARAHLQAGSDPAIRQLAERIDRSRTAQASQMLALLTELNAATATG